MVHPQSVLADLFATSLPPGRVVWIGLRPERHAPPRAVDTVEAVAGRGLAGDHYRTSRNGARQVTLVQAEHLAAVAGFLRRGPVTPDLLRRNLVIEGINLLGLKGRRFRIGGAVLEYSGECHPCSRMETALGQGGYQAMRGHGGITARVLESGVMALGDALELLDDA